MVQKIADDLAAQKMRIAAEAAARKAALPQEPVRTAAEVAAKSRTLAGNPSEAEVNRALAAAPTRPRLSVANLLATLLGNKPPAPVRGLLADLLTSTGADQVAKAEALRQAVAGYMARRRGVIGGSVIGSQMSQP
jgi:hypothetical protein